MGKSIARFTALALEWEESFKAHILYLKLSRCFFTYTCEGRVTSSSLFFFAGKEERAETPVVLTDMALHCHDGTLFTAGRFFP